MRIFDLTFTFTSNEFHVIANEYIKMLIFVRRLANFYAFWKPQFFVLHLLFPYILSANRIAAALRFST